MQPTLICENCKESVPASQRHCPCCEADLGFPNVRWAQSEQHDLDAHYNDSLAGHPNTSARIQALADYLGRQTKWKCGAKS